MRCWLQPDLAPVYGATDISLPHKLRDTVIHVFPVATIVFNNPAKRNAVSQEMWAAIPPMFDDLEADPDIRVVVLTGAGPWSALLALRSVESRLPDCFLRKCCCAIGVALDPALLSFRHSNIQKTWLIP